MMEEKGGVIYKYFAPWNIGLTKTKEVIGLTNYTESTMLLFYS